MLVIMPSRGLPHPGGPSSGLAQEFQLPAYSWAMWIKGDAPPTGSSTTQPLSNAHEQFEFSWNHTSPSFQQAAAHKTESGWVSAQIASPLEANTWYNIVGTYDGINLKVYLNGVLEGTTPVGSPNAASGPLVIGAASGGNFFDGQMDDVRIYNGALTAAEIGVLANTR